MQETRFKEFLENVRKLNGEPLKPNAIKSRLTLASKIEDLLNNTLDNIVSNDELMYSSLLKLKNDNDHNGNNQNTLRYYYKFINGREFPKLERYRELN